MILKRLSGILITLFSAASLLLSCFILFKIWQMKAGFNERLLTGVTLAADTLKNTGLALDVLGQSTIEASEKISITQSTLLILAESSHDTTAMIDSLVTLTGETLPGFITSTQASVDSAKNTAVLIDGIMNAISKIPFINQPYNPEKSLASSLSLISSDLQRLAPQLSQMEGDLRLSKANLILLEKQISSFASGLGDVQELLSQTSQVIDQYQSQIEKLQSYMAFIEKRLPGWIQILVYGLTFIIGWIALLQGYFVWKGLSFLFQRVAIK